MHIVRGNPELSNKTGCTERGWALQITGQPVEEVFTVPCLEANKKYAKLVLEVLLLRISLSLAESCLRLPNGFLPSIL